MSLSNLIAASIVFLRFFANFLKAAIAIPEVAIPTPAVASTVGRAAPAMALPTLPDAKE